MRALEARAPLPCPPFLPCLLAVNWVEVKWVEGQTYLQVTLLTSCLAFPYDGLRPRVIPQIKPLFPKLLWWEYFITARETKLEQCPLVIRSDLSFPGLLSWFIFQFCKHHVEKVPFTECLAKMLISRFLQSQEVHSALKAGDFPACRWCPFI